MQRGHVDVVAALLEYGADARALDAAGTSVLHYACYTCLSPAVVTLLLRAGALVRATAMETIDCNHTI